jgi:hypothetical protein
MERRLNCYNYIFGDCCLGNKCPYGHVVVNDKEEYKRRMELNIDHVNERTSPRGLKIINYECPIETVKDDSVCYLAPFYASCIYCKSLKIVKRKNRNKDYICKECRDKNAYEYLNKTIIRG